MKFARAKTILIFIFVFVNIFLLLVYKFFILNKKTVDNKTLLTVLSNNRIYISEELLSSKTVTLKGVEFKNLVNDKKGLVTNFFDGKYTEVSPTNYKNTESEIVITNSSVDFTINNPKEKKFKDISELNAGSKVINHLTKYGFEKSSLEVYNVTKNPNNDFYVTLAYKYDDIPVFNYNLYATANTKGLKNIKGPVITFSKIKNQKYTILPMADILLEFINNNDVATTTEDIHITSVNCGYYLPINETEVSTYAIPAYEIKTESGKIYYYDARPDVESEFRFLGSKIEL